MIVIVDNGKNADKIASLIRLEKQIVKPNKIPDADAYILTDGDMKHKKENQALIEKADQKPILAIGVGYLFLAGHFGSLVKEKGSKKGMEKLKMERPCPLLLDLKRLFSVVNDCDGEIEELTENFDVFATSNKYDFEMIQDMERPLFGLHFNPELGGDGRIILNNYVNFVEMWGKYHKSK